MNERCCLFMVFSVSRSLTIKNGAGNGNQQINNRKRVLRAERKIQESRKAVQIPDKEWSITPIRYRHKAIQFWTKCKRHRWALSPNFNIKIYKCTLCERLPIHASQGLAKTTSVTRKTALSILNSSPAESLNSNGSRFIGTCVLNSQINYQRWHLSQR